MRTKTKKTRAEPLAKLIELIGDSLNPESARLVLKIKADRRLQARVVQLGNKCSDGTLTEQERDEYRDYVRFGTYVAILKARARLLLSGASSKR
jgi:hypothetical protein